MNKPALEDCCTQTLPQVSNAKIETQRGVWGRPNGTPQPNENALGWPMVVFRKCGRSKSSDLFLLAKRRVRVKGIWSQKAANSDIMRNPRQSGHRFRRKAAT